MKFIISQKNKGSTLVETLFYIAIFVVISAVVMNSFIVMLKAFAQTKIERNILSGASYSLDRMSREIRWAYDIDSSSVFNSSSGYLKLNSNDDLGNPKTVELSFSNGALLLKENGVSSGDIMGSAKLKSLIFRQILQGTSEAIKIEMEAYDPADPKAKSEFFYDTILLRE